ncbi:MAG: hypothetical protein WCK34_13330 [Bacteroidota bacterium]
MKKSISFILLLFFLFNSMGYYILFEMDKYIIRREMHEVVIKEPVSMIVLKIANAEHNRDLKRTDSQEIEYMGMHYDVVREIAQGPARLFICLHDVKEDGLYSGLKKAHIRKLHLSLWDQVIKIAFPDPSVTPENITIAEVTFPHVSVPLLTLQLPTWSPPPELS